MEIVVVTAILIIGSTISGASYFVIKHTCHKPVNGEVENLKRIDGNICVVQKLVSNYRKHNGNSTKAIA